MTTATATKLWPMKRVRHHNQRLFVPIIDKPYGRILRLTRREDIEFDVFEWLRKSEFSCKTFCCIGGSVMFLAGKQGEDLQHAIDSISRYIAPRLILKHSSPLPVPSFEPVAYEPDEHNWTTLNAYNRNALALLPACSKGASVVKILDESKVADNRYDMMQKVGPAIIQAQLANPTPEGDQGMIEALCFLTATTYMKVRGIEYINETNAESATRILAALER